MSQAVGNRLIHATRRCTNSYIGLMPREGCQVQTACQQQKALFVFLPAAASGFSQEHNAIDLLLSHSSKAIFCFGRKKIKF